MNFESFLEGIFWLVILDWIILDSLIMNAVAERIKGSPDEKDK